MISYNAVRKNKTLFQVIPSPAAIAAEEKEAMQNSGEKEAKGV